MSTAIDLMNSWRVALSMPGLALRSTIGQTDAAAIKIESGTGAPTHTAVSASLYIRTDATDSGTWLYRNTDGATTWEAALDTEATELLTQNNVWTGTQEFGISGTGKDVTFYGDTATRDLIWDESTSGLRAQDNTRIMFGSGAGTTGDIAISWDGTKLVVAQLTANSAIDFGVDGAGIDLVLYGDTAGVRA